MLNRYDGKKVNTNYLFKYLYYFICYSLILKTMLNVHNVVFVSLLGALFFCVQAAPCHELYIELNSTVADYVYLSGVYLLQEVCLKGD